MYGILWTLIFYLIFHRIETRVKGRNRGIKMRGIVTNEVTKSQGFDARRRNEGMVGIGFQRGSLSGSGGHLVFGIMTDRLTGQGGGAIRRRGR